MLLYHSTAIQPGVQLITVGPPSLLLGWCCLADKVKTSIVVDRRVWEAFRRKVASERGLRLLSRAVEEALEEELVEQMLLEALDKLGLPPVEDREQPTVEPVEPRRPVRAEEVVREVREGRVDSIS
jgi:hypothetical protein